MQELNKDNLTIDMASTAKAIPEFAGTEQEDVFSWTKGAKLIAQVAGISDGLLLKNLIIKTRGQALNWTARLLEETPDISLERFIYQLHERFANIEKTHKTLEEFLQTKEAKNQKDFTEMLTKAELLVEKKCLNTTSCIKLIIARAPVVLKPILLQAATTSQTWDMFLKLAQDSMWIAFEVISTEKLIIENRNIYAVKKNSYEKKNENKKKFTKNFANNFFCRIHKEGSHSTQDCRTLKALRERGFDIVGSDRKEVRSIGEEDQDENVNKNKFVYSLNKKIYNPFNIKIFTATGYHNGVLDTGAEVTIINKKNLPPNSKINEDGNKTKVYSACGNRIEVLGTAKLSVLINRKKYKIKALVTENHPTLTLIGVDTLLKYPDLLNISNRNSNKNEVEIHNITTVDDLILKYKPIFKTEISELNACSIGKHEIILTDEKPIKQRNSRIPINYENEISKEIEKLLKLGLIVESTSPWCSRIVPVKKPDGTIRMCIDYRALNQQTQKDNYPIPRIDEILDSLGRGKYFTSLDATSGYYQIPLEDSCKSKTAFSWKSGLYEFTRMPFGLCNAPATFQRIIDKILRAELGKYVLAYLDDIIIFSNTKEEHEEHLDVVLAKLKAAGISLNIKKCKFFREEFKILGHVISKGIVKPDPDKINAIKNYSIPTTVKELRSFLGLANYCRDFIVFFAKKSANLCDLLKGATKKSNKKIEWNKIAKDSFFDLKKEILSITYRSQPNFENDFILITDASDEAIGAILAQRDKNGQENMIYAFSKKLDPAQKNYSITDKELLAAVKSIEHFRHYLLGKTFHLRTDHKALEYLWSSNNLNSRLTRWALKLQEYSFKIEYIKGELNAADGLSRQVFCNAVENRNKNFLEIIEDATKQEILKEYHEKSGHGSVNNMNFLIRKKYIWKSMATDIKDFVKKCRICTLCGYERTNTKNKIIKSSYPNELWEIDLIGRIESPNKNNKFIFIAIDHYTKWVETCILKTKDARSVAKAIQEQIIDKHGAPKRILSDNGLEFVNKEVSKITEKYGIDWKFSSPGHHETVGAVERANQTLMNKLRKITNIFEKSWEKSLKQATEAVNISFNRSIGTSPSIIKFGLAGTLEIDTKLGIVEKKYSITHTRNRRDQLFGKYSKRHIEKGVKECKYNLEPGDNCVIFKKAIGNKLGTQWKEGYKIVGKIEPDAYLVENGKERLRLNKKHVKKIFFLGRKGDVVI